MAAFRYPRTSQPQSPVGIDWGNPLTRGLTSCLVLINGSIIDVVKNRVLLNSSNLVQRPTRSGLGLKPTTPAGQTLAGYFQNVTEFTRVFVATPQITGTGAISDSSTSSQGAEIQITASNIALNRAAAVNYVNFAISGTAPVNAAVICSPTRQIICVNGRAGTPRSGAVSFSALGSGTLFAGSTSSEKFDGTLLLHFDYNRALSDAEGVAISANPWQIFTPQSRQIWVPTAGGGVNYSLLCDAGAFTLAGQDATLTYTAGTANYTLTCDAGAFALAGQDATLTYTPGSASVAYSLLCDAGAYALAGQDAALVYVSNAPVAYSLTCDAGAYSISGQEATLTFSGQTTHGGGVPPWNPYQATGESEEQKRNRRIAQGIIRQAQKPSADIEKLSVKAKDISQRLKADAEQFDAFAAQLGIELDRAYNHRLLSAAMQAKNNALATRQLEQQVIQAQLQAEAARQQIEELDVVFMAVMLAAL